MKIRRNDDETGESGVPFLLWRRRRPWAQVNAGEQKPEASDAVHHDLHGVVAFELPWRIAFLPDGNMLISEKIGPVWLVSPQGQKIAVVGGTPPVYWQGQSGMLGVFISPTYATDQSIYLTYSEPGDYGGGLALARAKLNITGPGGRGGPGARLTDFKVLWHQMPKGKGGQEGAGFAPKQPVSLMPVSDAALHPRQDPNEPVGKILHLTLDGKPSPDNPSFGKTGARTVPLIDPPKWLPRPCQDREGIE